MVLRPTLCPSLRRAQRSCRPLPFQIVISFSAALDTVLCAYRRSGPPAAALGEELFSGLTRPLPLPNLPRRLALCAKHDREALAVTPSPAPFWLPESTPLFLVTFPFILSHALCKAPFAAIGNGKVATRITPYPLSPFSVTPFKPGWCSIPRPVGAARLNSSGIIYIFFPHCLLSASSPSI